MLAHAARWAQISFARGSAPTSVLVVCVLASVLATPVVDRLHLSFAAVAFSAVVSLMPGFFLFNAATGLVELASIGPSAPATGEHRGEWRHDVSDHHGHDLGADSRAHVVRGMMPSPA
jgi:hypothetical protein